MCKALQAAQSWAVQSLGQPPSPLREKRTFIPFPHVRKTPLMGLLDSEVALDPVQNFRIQFGLRGPRQGTYGLAPFPFHSLPISPISSPSSSWPPPTLYLTILLPGNPGDCQPGGGTLVFQWFWPSVGFYWSSYSVGLALCPQNMPYGTFATVCASCELVPI